MDTFNKADVVYRRREPKMLHKVAKVGACTLTLEDGSSSHIEDFEHEGAGTFTTPNPASLAAGPWYLATPYSKYEGGTGAAFILACQQAGLLIRAGVPVFSPIAHTHPIAELCRMDKLDHSIWLPADEPMMAVSRGVIMLMAPGWTDSYGMRVEEQTFRAAGKPVVYMTPGEIPPTVLR